MLMNPTDMMADIDHWLLSPEQIQARVAELGHQIEEDYRGKDLLLIGILKGAVPFFADLMRNINIPLSIDFMAISSYGSASKSTGIVRILKDLDHPITGKHVIVVEDIVDSGMTLSFLRENLITRGPESIAICTLLDKPEGRRVELTADYWGFNVPNEFVVGYGLDYAQKYRNLPGIGVLKPEIYTD